ncbi:efflux RND transporter periplasmic adaptor subunit [Chloroflexota bacterium]
MKRIVNLMLTGLLLGGLFVPLLGCGSDSVEDEAAQNQTITVQRGDLTIDITAVGNLALSRTEDLAFDLFYPEGTVEEVLVEEGDTVEEGQALAKVDTLEWADELSTLEDDVITAERQLAAEQRDLIQAKINLSNAETSLEETDTTYDLTDFKVAQVAIDEAEENLEDTLFIWSKYDEGTTGYDHYTEVVRQAQTRLDTAEDRLEAMSAGFDTEEIAIKKLQVELAQGRLEDAQMAIVDAEKALSDAQEDLDEAKGKSPIITAPFAGFITMVNVEGGDDIMTGTVAVQLADPAEFEADIMVSEMDILQVKLGGEALVGVDAMQGLSLPAEVTHISPTATIQQGVVNYTVKVELQSSEAAAQERQEARQEVSENITEQIQQGELPDHLKQAIAEGRNSQERTEETRGRRQSGEISSGGRSQGQTSTTQESGRGQTSPTQESGQRPTTISESSQLREGLTVTVSIIVDSRTNVLIVPNSAITTQRRQTYVNVVLPDGSIEERAIEIGITDYQFTEATEGLSEGEQVVISLGSTTTTSTTQQRQDGQRMYIPGMGRPR